MINTNTTIDLHIAYTKDSTMVPLGCNEESICCLCNSIKVFLQKLYVTNWKNNNKHELIVDSMASLMTNSKLVMAKWVIYRVDRAIISRLVGLIC